MNVNIYSLVPDATTMKQRADRIQGEAAVFQNLATTHSQVAAYAQTPIQLTINGFSVWVEASVQADEIRKQVLTYLVDKMNESKRRYETYVKEAAQ